LQYKRKTVYLCFLHIINQQFKHHTTNQSSPAGLNIFSFSIFTYLISTSKMPSYAKTLITTLAVSSVASAYRPYGESNSIYARDAYADYPSVWAREAEPEDDHLTHIYARDLEARDLQIRDDFEAALRLRELAQRDPELFELYAREPKHWKIGAAIGGTIGAVVGGGVPGAIVGAAVGGAGEKLLHKVKEKFTGKKNGNQEGQGQGQGQGQAQGPPPTEPQAQPAPGMRRRSIDDYLWDFDF
jgi:hypothetical protein